MVFDPDPRLASILAGRFRQGAAYGVNRPRGSTSWLMIATVSGVGQVGEVEVAPGEAALIPPHAPHAYRTSKRRSHWELLWVHFHPRAEWVPLLTPSEAAPGVRHVKLSAETDAVFAALDRACAHGSRSADPFEEWLAMGALEEVLVRTRRATAQSELGVDPRVRAAVAFARQRMAEPIGPGEMACAAGVSPSRLGTLFRTEVGASPRAFIERIRLDRARQLLAMSDLPVRVVASEVGYASEFYFANRFRQIVGTSPSAYRAASRGS